MILGVLLAAGTGSRFEDGNKLLADVDDETTGSEATDSEPTEGETTDGASVVSRAARTLANSSVDAVVAVVGHDREAVERELPDGVDVLYNVDFEAGQSTSVKLGVEFARKREADAALFALGDMPSVSVETIEKLLAAYRDDEGDIVVPRYEGERGNPVLFDSQYFDALADVKGDTGGRELIEREVGSKSEPVAWVDVSDPGVRQDVDTAEDLAELRDE